MGKTARLIWQVLLIGCALVGVASAILCLATSCVPIDTVQTTPTHGPLLSTVPELIAWLSDPNLPAHDKAAYKLANMGSEAAPAVPALITALSEDNSGVQEAAAWALGEIGPEAALAVPDLMHVLHSDDNTHVLQQRSAIALGKIRQRAAVPALAEVLWYDGRGEEGTAADAAWAIAQLTGEPFPDSDPDQIGYSLDEDSELLIVLAARQWWLTQGQYQDWGELP